MGKEVKGHVLVLPYPIQGHINPMLQFSKRLVSKGLTVTLAITTFVAKSMEPPQNGSIRIKTISDGFDDGFSKQSGSVEVYLDSFKTVGSQTLSDLIVETSNTLQPFCCVVYDAFLEWVLDVTKEFGLLGAPFFTQSCAVNSIYYHAQQGLLSVPVEKHTVVSLPGLPPLESSDLPSFVSIHGYGSYPSLLSLLLGQFSNINKADCVLVNSFDKMEPEVVNWMSKLWKVRTIGPTVPEKDHGLNLFQLSTDACIGWLNTKQTGSVVYVSFGSLAELTAEQMEELAWGLRGCDSYFLWVVREAETSKLPSRFIEETSEKGLVVSWCPQLEVLGHRALGCFVTHCGWNSTLEAVIFGIPMVALPQWSDQPMNAKYVKDVLKTGFQVGVDEDGISRRGEIERCIREVMEGEHGKEIRRNAIRWKNLAKEAVDEGGSSDKNIEEFVSSLVCVNHSL